MILILGGTSTTHEIIKTLSNSDYIISVTTEYGYSEFNKRYPSKVLHTRFTTGSLTKFIKEKSIKQVIDSTHPHAKEITKNAIEVCTALNIPYINKIRTLEDIHYNRMHMFTSYDDAAAFVQERGYKSVLITTGSNNIDKFAGIADVSYARVLPFEKSLQACLDAGFHYSRIIAMQGPFSESFNIALIHEINADCFVTKNSGTGSGYAEKISACEKCGIDMVTVQPE
ncbi:precorrin-6A reductase [Deferribacteres bacterium DY0037]